LRPAWAATASELNSRLDDKAAMKIFKAGLELAAQGADPESQTRDLERLRKAEDRFTLLVDELAPNFAGGYANRANVRVAIGGDEALRGALEDYSKALELAPEGKDAWVNRLNRGSTLVGLGMPEEALADLDMAVALSKKDILATLARGAAYHALGRWSAAAMDYGAAIAKNPADVQPFWLRYALESFQLDRRTEALGIGRRTANKFDLEPECVLALCAMLAASPLPADRDEAARRWGAAPAPVRMAAADFLRSPSFGTRQWPPAVVAAAEAFLAAPPASAQLAPAAAATPLLGAG